VGAGVLSPSGAVGVLDDVSPEANEEAEGKAETDGSAEGE